MRERSSKAAALLAFALVGAATIAAPATAATAPVVTTIAAVHLLDVRASRTTSPVRGYGTVTSDFDGDGVDDLAFVAEATPGAGDPLSGPTLIVRYSSAPYTDYIAETVDGGGGIGTSIATGDFNGDGFTDIAVGDLSATVTVGGKAHAGAGSVWIIPGGGNGLDVAKAKQFTEQTAGVPGTAETDDEFGAALAAGDINGDGYADLAIGAPGESIGTLLKAGSVTVLFGGVGGLSATGATAIDQNTSGIPGTSEFGDEFGYSVAIGKVTGDKYADLAIGSPYENTYGFLQDGMVTLVDGAASGLSLSHVTDVTGGQLNHTSVWPFNIGTSLVIADTNGDGLGEVIVAAPGTQRNNPPTDPIAGAGAVFVLHGAKAGISASGALTIGEDTPGVPGVAEEEDGFGFRIAAGDITGDGRADLLIGVPYEDIGSTADAGVVYLVPSSPSGLLPSKTTTVNQGSPGVPGSIATDDLFGLALGIHNLAGTSAMEALVGTPNDGGPNAASSGSITTFTSNGGTLAPGVRWTTADFAISDGTTFTNMPMPYGGVPGPGL